MTTLANVQSTVTPVAPVAATKLNGKTKTKALASTSLTNLTKEQAIEIAYNYGANVAGADGGLTNAFKVFAKDDDTIADMVHAIAVGYMERKLGYSKAEAARVVGLAKYNDVNPSKNSDKNRTAEQERVMVSVRMLVSRAKKMAGVTKPIATPSAAETAEREARKTNIQALAEIVYPAKTDDVDVNAAMTRLVLTMRAYQNKYSAKFVGDTGSAWRDWLASAPIVITKQ